jgi:surface antigen
VRVLAVPFLVAGLLLLAGCGPSGTGPSGHAAAVAVQVPAGPPPPAGVIAGPLGASLTEADRQAGFSAQIAALDQGQRRSWKGSNGTFGYVEPGAESGACRVYTQTVYIDGRPRSGQGQACRQPDGSWKF